MSEDKKHQRGQLGQAVNRLLLILILILVPVTFEQLREHPEALPWIGRFCAGAALVFLIHGVMKSMFKVVALLLFVGIVLAVLVSEGIVTLPHIYVPEK